MTIGRDGMVRDKANYNNSPEVKNSHNINNNIKCLNVLNKHPLWRGEEYQELAKELDNESEGPDVPLAEAATVADAADENVLGNYGCSKKLPINIFRRNNFPESTEYARNGS